ncbi:hypothetical protein P692DRAFT_20859584 [Suillus brevipes Sb2]|nr:hypothetical protein P692DRAFT_20859584 [Suillus brevipes Sb2]
MATSLFGCEILLAIFKYSLAWKFLAALARTCKHFYEPAMDLLWAEMHGIVQMLGCVTRLYPIIYPNSKLPWPSQGIEPLSEHEARQFLRHASRVRSLRVEHSEHFHLLANLPTDTCVFPNLLSLFFIADESHARYLNIFLSPTLRRFKLSVIHPDFKYIATPFAALKHLTIESRWSLDEDNLSLLSNSVRLCKQLATLSCPPLDWAAWKQISNIPTLLTVKISNPFKTFHLPLVWNVHDFASFRNLTGLFFDVNTAGYTIAVEQLCRALVQCEANQSLEHIEMTSFSQRMKPLKTVMVITQFFCFTQLQTLRLDFDYCCFKLDNNCLLEAVESWPHIRSLELVDLVTRPTVTFRGLFTALPRCPNLLSLDMPVDAVKIDIDPTTESFQHTTLESLNLARSSVGDAEAVARIIFFMSPRRHYHTV